MPDLDTIVNLCKRRGFIFPSSEIYGGLGSCWDYGPLGVLLKNNVKRLWWRDMVERREDMVGLDASILMHPMTWKASGHVDHFADPLVDCLACRARFRFDEITGETQYSFTLQHKNGTGKLIIGYHGQACIDQSTNCLVVLLKVRALNATFTITAAPLIATIAGNTQGVHPSGVPPCLPWNSRETLLVQHDRRTIQPGPGQEFILVYPIPANLKPEQANLYIDLAVDEMQETTAPCSLKANRYFCRKCGNGQLTEPRMFNLMFRTFIGPVQDEGAQVYLRPETAQGIFVNFENVLTAMRKKLPFGIGQIGKSFRNEITPQKMIFRTLEFEQMEIEYFVKPGDDERAHEEWKRARMDWYARYGIRAENLKLRAHGKEELAHYAKGCYDVEYNFPWGWSELEGIANRTDFDLKQHAQFSGKTLTYFDDATKQHVTPYVIEPSAGADRSALAFLIDAYHEEVVKEEKRVVLRFHPEVAPFKVAVFPLLKNKPEIVKQAKEIAAECRKHFTTWYDDTAAIGKLYRRQDEVGTPLCVTVDVQSLEDKKATVRDRDTMAQDRVAIAELVPFLRDKLKLG